VRIVYSQDLVIHTVGLIDHLTACLAPLSDHIHHREVPADNTAKALLHEAREKLCEAAEAIGRDLGQIEISLATDLRDCRHSINGVTLKDPEEDRDTRKESAPE
jgi:hypothetical protein